MYMCVIQELLVEEEEMGKFFKRKPKNQVVLEGQFNQRPSWTRSNSIALTRSLQQTLVTMQPFVLYISCSPARCSIVEYQCCRYNSCAWRSFSSSLRASLEQVSLVNSVYFKVTICYMAHC